MVSSGLGWIEEIKKLTNLQTLPNLIIKQMDKGVEEIISDEIVLRPAELYLSEFYGYNNMINLTITEIIQAPYITKEEVGIWTGIFVQGESFIQLLLATGLALYLSQQCNTPIIDERCYWVNHRAAD